MDEDYKSQRTIMTSTDCTVTVARGSSLVLTASDWPENEEHNGSGYGLAQHRSDRRKKGRGETSWRTGKAKRKIGMRES